MPFLSFSIITTGMIPTTTTTKTASCTDAVHLWLLVLMLFILFGVMNVKWRLQATFGVYRRAKSRDVSGD